MPAWKDKLANGEILLIDGAMGTELERRGVPMHEETWSGAAVIEHPDAIIGAHEDYIRAGGHHHQHLRRLAAHAQGHGLRRP
jgi:homocysteine S-methyltransferase